MGQYLPIVVMLVLGLAWGPALAIGLAKSALRARTREALPPLVVARSLHISCREALRRAIAVLALPQNVPAAARLGWRTSDLMWRLAGDTATDYNHYTKRAMLLATYAATITVFLDDDSEGHAETRAFLARRIDDIMAIEKAKASATARTRYRPSLSRFVGRLRYPVA